LFNHARNGEEQVCTVTEKSDEVCIAEGDLKGEGRGEETMYKSTGSARHERLEK